MSTIYKQGVSTQVTRLLSEPEWMMVLSMHIHDLRNSNYPDSYVDVLGQEWRKGNELESAYAFANMHTWIREGDIVLCSIDVGTEPTNDARIIEMNRRLKDLPIPFRAEFWGGTADVDGVVSWNRPIHAVIRRGRNTAWVLVPPGKIGLEVGYVDPRKMMLYLNPNSGQLGMARWPYGQERITVLLNAKYHARGTGHPDFESLRSARGNEMSSEINPNCQWDEEFKETGRTEFGLRMDRERLKIRCEKTLKEITTDPREMS